MARAKSGVGKGTLATCVVCSVEFVRKNLSAVTCGRVCGNRLSQISRSANAAERRTRQCASCGVTFVAHKWSGKALRGEVVEGTYCSSVCRAATIKKYASRAEKEREHARARSRRLASLRQEARPFIPCVICGDPFKQHGNKRFCSQSCRLTSSLLPVPKSPIQPRSCLVCSAVFAPAKNPRTATCSDVCLSERRRAQRSVEKATRKNRLAAGQAELVHPLLVFRRDGWKCHLCGKKTLASKRGSSHKLAPELDHILPLSRGGRHSYDNVACACRKCNGAKGASPRGQMLLFGSFIA